MTSRALLNNSNNKNKINSVGEDDDEFDKSLNRTKSVNNNNNKMKRADSSWKSIDDGEEEEGDDDDDEDDDLENELENDLENEDATTTKEKSPIKHTSCSSQQQHASTTSKQHLLKYLKNSISTISLSELASIPDIDIDIARMKVSQMIQTSSEAASQFVGRMSQTMQKNLDVGYELYKRNWSTENRKVMLFLISAVFAAITLIVFWVVVVYLAWKEIGRWLTSKVVIGIFGVVFLAVAPPLFPNIFAHMLAVLIIGMEAFSLTLNLIMLGCVHLIVFANRALAFSNLFRKFRVVSRKESDVSKLDIDRTNRAILIEKLRNVKNYKEWLKIANELDALPVDAGEGGNDWKRDETSDAYDHSLVRGYAETMRTAREAKDANAIGLALRTVLHRNFAGLDRLMKLPHSRVGTKLLVTWFKDETIRAIEFIADECKDESKVVDNLKLVREAHRSLGRTALCLSGGGALAMYHFGVIRSLLEEGLCPSVVSGTSGGSIVAAFISVMPEDELLGTITDDISDRYGVRWFPPVYKMIVNFLQHGTLMSESDFANTTKQYFGDFTFEEAYAISKRHVSIQVSVGSGHGFVLNHVTSPKALVRTAVCASCALPGLMRPSPILCKSADGQLIPFHPPGVSSFDGTITADIPAARLTELFNCNNFIVSQVNPHLNFVLHLAEETHGRRRSTYAERGKNRRAAVTKLLRVANFLLLNIKYSIQKLLEVDLLNLRILRTLSGILVQDFQGHITILPSLTFKDYCSIIRHPSNKDMNRFIRRGAQTSWPHVESVRHTMEVETALKKATLKLTKRARELKADRLKKPQKPPSSIRLPQSTTMKRYDSLENIETVSPRVGLEDDMLFAIDR
jgi:TAG lipase / steryl ester hydrolase / phospholipase A2 / LPA acyltransferase